MGQRRLHYGTFAALILLITFATGAYAGNWEFLANDATPTAGGFITGHSAQWTCDLALHNDTGADVTVTTSNTIIGPVPSEFLKPDWSALLTDFAKFEPLDASGFGWFEYTGSVAASMAYSYTGAHGEHSYFELAHPLSVALANAGDTVWLNDVRVSGSIGTFVTYYNRGPNAQVIRIDVYDAHMVLVGHEEAPAPLGLSQYSIHTPLTSSGRLKLTLGTVVTGGDAPATVYVFAVVGPPNGTSQGIRYPTP